jgi:hypothetical protein
MNTSLVVEGDEETVVATLPAWTRRRLLHALRVGGFQVEEERSLLNMGGDRIRYRSS